MMTDLNSQLNYANSLHYQQQQQLQNHLQKLQSNIKTGHDKVPSSNNNNTNENPLLNIPLDQQQQNQQRPQPQQHHQSAQMFTNNGLFTDTLSPFFAPYGIDVSHFPLTNPPIFESALMVNNQGQPRRRISISNGQIGQITTHSLNGDDLYDSQPPPLPKPSSQDDSNINQQLYNPSLGLDPLTPNIQIPPQPQQQQQVPPPQQIPQHLVNVPPPQQPPIPQQQQQPPPPPPQQQQQQVKQNNQPYTTLGQSGIPNHKLVYNNEVIFNPDAGPIPGTAAWKKARLLERNRIAASKCRQRKKAAHIQLKEDVEKYQFQINQLKKDKKRLIDFYQEVKMLYETNRANDVEELGKLLGGISFEDFSNGDFEVNEDEDDDYEDE